MDQTAKTKGTFTFFETEIRTGLTFAGIARQATHEDKIRRNLSAAQRAYEAVCHFSRRVPLTLEEARQLEPRLEELRQELSALNERLPMMHQEQRQQPDESPGLDI